MGAAWLYEKVMRLGYKLGASANPFVHCPSVSWELSGQDLLNESGVRKDLGRADLFVSAERLTDVTLPWEVGGTLCE